MRCNGIETTVFSFLFEFFWMRRFHLKGVFLKKKTTMVGEEDNSSTFKLIKITLLIFIIIFVFRNIIIIIYFILALNMVYITTYLH